MKRLALFLTLILFVFCTKSEVADSTSLVNDNLNQVDEPLVLSDDVINSVFPCQNGMAGIYPCSGYDLLARISLEDFESASGNDNWGWTDPETGKEYVLSGLDDGTAFVDISNPEAPVFLGKLLTATEPSSWRDIKVYDNHAFIVSEAPQHGLQVFDLTKLRNLTADETFTADTRLNDFGSAHNIAINEESGFAYVIGSDLYEGGPVFIDINNPKNPEIEGGYSGDSYTHDAQIVIYNGPDTNFQGRELFFGSNSDGGANNKVVIVDVTDKENPQRVNTITYENGGYTHQGYLSEDHTYFFLGDELDELRFGSPSQTRIFDLTDLMNPLLHLNYFAGVNAIDHNGYSKNDLFYIANYTAGLRVLDISEIGNRRVSEIGFFDTYPQDNNAKFEGLWNVYPYFESGVIAINDINSGLFLVKASE
ncbi:MAG: choice-of-anchor B family protein [Flavobacteriaceae bacterium]|nr:choice-of-anchor B family protein [Flavobacteriaceae bacterium]MDG2502840.1 choice-of-anchor B family protein [Flavobacteriaceae bacterium]|tara:strand:- start:3162 stop:4427 length:1266 start_codon:yes stop_codon:yes gene_type:complete